ncbi:hypothetical protein CQY20_11320 [Mycolicibacterium agri]|uniref:Cell wall synthesis protein Wag31 n=1 Tax=Mycolicibacterium agri TaxID=36811 RepID=A0A2A7N4X1_MYCAG|nr:DivIVA domain-containing protein [Mycolicibacterium agri]PEG39132.1 hypothetical protein CQY20_11320 [Mycolicibacterium agri]GFG53938.1 hypothetical protein MAGR_53790 [Mycolicibacterium agri]
MEQDPAQATPRLTAEDVHNVAFSPPPAGKRGYREGEVDVFLDRIEAALRDPSRRSLTAEQIRSVAFPEASSGSRSYNADEVNAFLELAAGQLAMQQRDAGSPVGSAKSVRALLYRVRHWNSQEPALALEVTGDAVRLFEGDSNALIATAPLTEVTVTPANALGIPVLIIEGPGMETMVVQPHPPPGEWRMKTKGRKSDYSAVEKDWLMLAERFGLASELVDEKLPQTFLEHVMAFRSELRFNNYTWRTPAVAAVIAFVLAALGIGNPLVVLAIGVGLAVLAAVFWRYNLRL